MGAPASAASALGSKWHTLPRMSRGLSRLLGRVSRKANAEAPRRCIRARAKGSPDARARLWRRGGSRRPSLAVVRPYRGRSPRSGRNVLAVSPMAGGIGRGRTPRAWRDVGFRNPRQHSRGPPSHGFPNPLTNGFPDGQAPSCPNAARARIPHRLRSRALRLRRAIGRWLTIQLATKMASISALTCSSVCLRAIAISLTMSERAVSSIRRSPKLSCLSVFRR